MIPKKLYFTYKTEVLPEVYEENLRRWKVFCPDWDIAYYSDETARAFLYEHFPTCADSISKVQHGVVLADLFRYGILYIFGGMYSDIDTVPLKRIPEKWLSFKGVLGYEYQPKKFCCYDIPSYRKETLCQWTLLSAPGHPLFKEAFEQSLLRVEKQNFTFNHPIEVLKASGPLLFTAIAEKYLSDSTLLLLDMDLFAAVNLRNSDLKNSVVLHQDHGASGWKLEIQVPQIKVL